MSPCAEIKTLNHHHKRLSVLRANLMTLAATVSYHLSLLKKAGLIFESREKNFIYYSLNASVLEEVLLWLQDLKGEGKK